MNFPKYNPFAFELARHVRGWTKTYLAAFTRLSVKAVSEIERGDRLPSKIEFERISYALDFPEGFFMEFHETRLQLDPRGCLAKLVPIDYMGYRVVRLLNNSLKSC